MRSIRSSNIWKSRRKNNFIPIRVSEAPNWKLAAQPAEVSCVPFFFFFFLYGTHNAEAYVEDFGNFISGKQTFFWLHAPLSSFQRSEQSFIQSSLYIHVMCLVSSFHVTEWAPYWKKNIYKEITEQLI